MPWGFRDVIHHYFDRFEPLSHFFDSSMTGFPDDMLRLLLHDPPAIIRPLVRIDVACRTCGAALPRASST